MRSQRGFTLIEALIVIFIIVTVTAIAIPQFQRMAVNGNLRSAARDIMGDFANLRERALSGDATLGNRMYRISLNPSAQSYQLQQCTSTGSSCPGWNTIQIKNFTSFGNGIGFIAGNTNPTNYTFQTRGTITSGSIVLQNNRGSTATITVLTAGRIFVEFALQ
jgi:prepilin-type N-terminal cleavage/methylation domain-containing protein